MSTQAIPGSPSRWFQTTKNHHATTDSDNHAAICDQCGAAWTEIVHPGHCVQTRCDDCGPIGGLNPDPPGPYAMSSWDAIYDCRGIRCLPVT